MSHFCRFDSPRCSEHLRFSSNAATSHVSIFKIRISSPVLQRLSKDLLNRNDRQIPMESLSLHEDRRQACSDELEFGQMARVNCVDLDDSVTGLAELMAMSASQDH
jgi:hypothetical protein